MENFPPQRGGSDLDIESGGVSGSQRNPEHLEIAPPSSEMIITIISLVWMIVAFLLNLDYPIKGDDGNKVLNALFHQHPMSFSFIVMICVAAFFFMTIWMMMIVGRYRPPIARYLSLAIFVLGVLVSTVLMYALLPKKFGWIVWFLFALTIWVMLVMQGCDFANRWTDKIRMLVVKGYQWVTRWTDTIPPLYDGCCLPIHSPSVTSRTSQTVLLIIKFI